VTALLETRALTKRYDGPRAAVIEAVGGVDLALAEGTFHAIVGPSGCGKSTLLRMVAGLLEPTSGEVALGGRAGSARLLEQVGYLPQRDLLMPWRTVLGNVSVGLELAGVPKREARDRAGAELPRFGLGGFAGRRPHELSDGMRQRAALLRTVLAGRRILLLDEPFGALDAITRRTMQEWLLELREAERLTVLLVTHDLDEAVLMADRVSVMTARPGRIAETVEIPLARPRSEDSTLKPEFAAAKGALLAPLRAGTKGGRA
jgi:ABC-type nitrate/sulfonate/bicarbonate transport system ATPase subunit